MICARRAVTRQSDAAHFSGRPYVIRIEPGARLIRVKLKGRRLWYTVSIEQLFLTGCRNKAEEDRRERDRLRQERREERRKMDAAFKAVGRGRRKGGTR